MTTLEFIHVQKAKCLVKASIGSAGRRNERKPNAVTCAAHEVFAKIRKREQALLRTATARQNMPTRTVELSLAVVEGKLRRTAACRLRPSSEGLTIGAACNSTKEKKKKQEMV